MNPLLQFGLEETRKALLENILTDLSVIRYVPFDSDTIGNPALDLGDVLVFSGGHADETQTACVTGYQVKINGKHSLKCVGKNPRLAQAKSKNDKNISGLLNQIEAGKIGIHTFTNASSYSVSGTDVKIISIEFAAAEETHVQFFAIVLVDVAAEETVQSGTASGTVVVPVPSVAEDGTETTVDVSVEMELPVTVSADGKAIASVRYEFNDEEILIHYPTETWGSGRHVLPLYYPIENLIPNFTNTFNVYLRMDGGTGQIETGGCIASISGQGMAAAPAWDGKITLDENIPLFSVGGGMIVKGFSETIGVETMELVQRQMVDSIARIGIGAFGTVVDTG